MSSLDGVNAVTIIFAALCVFAIGYRFYGLFIAAKVLNVDANRVTPAVKYADGQDYVKTDKFVLFGHHFAAIAAAGPLLGPVLAAQFGYLPGLLWILIGCVLAGGVHDMVVLFCSVRHKGRSLAYICHARNRSHHGVCGFLGCACDSDPDAGGAFDCLCQRHARFAVVDLHGCGNDSDRHHHGLVSADLAQG